MAVPKLLVVDDEPSIPFGIELVLESEHVQVFAARSADEALSAVAEQAPDAIILDIHLGRRSGFDLFKDLKRIDPRLPIIFITGRGTADMLERAKELGAFELMVKPLDITSLRRVVMRAIEASRAAHAAVRDAGTTAPEAGK